MCLPVLKTGNNLTSQSEARSWCSMLSQRFVLQIPLETNLKCSEIIVYPNYMFECL